jgi:hypothetical protein
MPDPAGSMPIPSLALAEPPPLPRTGFGTSFAAPLAAGAGAIFATIAGRLMMAGALPAPKCRWLRWTGIPCPGCGATRCLGACGRFDLLDALRWNPLVAGAVIALLAWGVMALGDLLFKTRSAERLGGAVRAVLTDRRIAACVALNWLYLCWALPR